MSDNTFSVTPVVVVDLIEPSLPFWEKGLGFSRLDEVPHEGRLGFVILGRGDAMVMLQSRASVAADLPPESNADRSGPTFLFVKVDSIASFLETPPPGATLVVPRRTTFYGMDEVGYRAPDGTIVLLACPVAGGTKEEGSGEEEGST